MPRASRGNKHARRVHSQAEKALVGQRAGGEQLRLPRWPLERPRGVYEGAEGWVVARRWRVRPAGVAGPRCRGCGCGMTWSRVFEEALVCVGAGSACARQCACPIVIAASRARVRRVVTVAHVCVPKVVGARPTHVVEEQQRDRRLHVVDTTSAAGLVACAATVSSVHKRYTFYKVCTTILWQLDQLGRVCYFGTNLSHDVGVPAHHRTFPTHLYQRGALALPVGYGSDGTFRCQMI